MERSVVVTGANSGIGLATALDLSRHGFQVFGTVRSEAKGAELVAAAREKGCAMRYVVCDVADAAATERAFGEIAELTGGGPWAVVNNAGYAQPGAVEDVTDEQAKAQFEVNVFAPLRIARLVLPAMRERGEGRIVNVSSVAGRIALPMVGWYAASKHALEALSDVLRIETAGFGVKVIVIEPGSFGTGIWTDGAARLPDLPDSAYASSYARAGRYREPSRLLPDPVWVARAVRHALSSRRPLRRYLVGVDAMVGTALDAVTPHAIGDLVKGASVGVRRLPFR